VVGLVISHLVHNCADQVDATAMLIERMSWLEILLNLEAFTEIIDPDEQATFDDADLDVDLLGWVADIGMLDGIGHSLGQDQIQIISKLFTVAAIMPKRTRDILTDMTDQAQVACLIRDFDINRQPVGRHGPLLSSSGPRDGVGSLLLEAAEGFVNIVEDLEDPMQSGQLEHRFNL
jgi:hypothetical protein